MAYVKRKFDSIYVDGIWAGTKVTGPNGYYTKTYDRDDRLHSFNGEPSVVYPGWKIAYHKHGKYHRIGGPAVETPYREIYYHNGRKHRDNDLPAMIYHSCGECYAVSEFGWYKHGKRHRDCDEPAFVSMNIGCLHSVYFKNGTKHREKGPADICAYEDGGRKFFWYRDGQLVPADALLTEMLAEGRAVWLDDEGNLHESTEYIEDQIIAHNFSNRF